MKQSFLRFSQALIRSAFIYSLREAFIALIPYLVIVALSALIVESFRIFTFLNQSSALYQWILSAAITIQNLFPFVVVVAISYFNSVNTGVNPLVGSLLAAACFVSGTGYFRIHADGIVINTQSSTIYMILVPAITTFLMAKCHKLPVFNIVKNRFISVFLVKHINLILPFVVIFVAFSTLFPLACGLIEQGARVFVPTLSPEHATMNMLQWTVVSHVFWLLGIHGMNFINSMMPPGELLGLELFPNTPIGSFTNVFMFFGGSGSVWGFVIAVFLMGKDEQLQQIAKVSVPFQIFNISEVVTYGIPLVLNPYFIVPFLICPLVNCLASYIAIYSGLFHLSDTYVSWITPAVLSGYLATDGNIAAALLQALLIVVNAYIYMPFVRWYSQANSEQLMFEQLSNKLSLAPEIEVQSEKSHVVGQGQSFSASKELKQIIEDVVNGDFVLYYQPKINNQLEFDSFEALLRLRRADGKIVGPYFLSQLEDAGLSEVIDLWVIEKVRSDLLLWQQQDFYPKVSINLNPHMLASQTMIDKLIFELSAFKNQTEVEILETAYVENFMQIRENIEALKQHGISAAIDDFGSGFSSLSLLYKLNVQTIKIDRSILINIDTEKGRILYEQLCHLCKKLGFTLVAEGVETAQQAEFVRHAGVDLIQGWLYSAALAPDEARQYANTYGNASAAKTAESRR